MQDDYPFDKARAELIGHIEEICGKPLTQNQIIFLQRAIDGYRVKYDRVKGLHMVEETTEGGNPQDQQ